MTAPTSDYCRGYADNRDRDECEPDQSAEYRRGWVSAECDRERRMYDPPVSARESEL